MDFKNIDKEKIESKETHHEIITVIIIIIIIIITIINNNKHDFSRSYLFLPKFPLVVGFAC